MAAADDSKDAAVSTAQSRLALMDSGKYPESWDEAANRQQFAGPSCGDLTGEKHCERPDAVGKHPFD
jgi:hypothetical protein